MFNTAFNKIEEDSMKLIEDDLIEERYTGHKTAPYVGNYRTNGKTFNCLLHISSEDISFPLSRRKVVQIMSEVSSINLSNP